MDDSKAQARRVLTLRAFLGLSQADFRELLDISTGAMSDFESGKRRISLELADNLKRTCGASLDWLFYGYVGNLPQELFARLIECERQADEWIAKPNDSRKRRGRPRKSA